MYYLKNIILVLETWRYSVKNSGVNHKSSQFTGLKRKAVSKGKLYRIQLGKIIAEGWIKQQLEIEASGTNGHMDELEPEMLTKAFISRKLNTLSEGDLKISGHITI